MSGFFRFFFVGPLIIAEGWIVFRLIRYIRREATPDERMPAVVLILVAASICVYLIHWVVTGSP